MSDTISVVFFNPEKNFKVGDIIAICIGSETEVQSSQEPCPRFTYMATELRVRSKSDFCAMDT